MLIPQTRSNIVIICAQHVRSVLLYAHLLQILDMDLHTGGIIWEVEGRGSGSKGVAYHTDSPTQVEVFDLGW